MIPGDTNDVCEPAEEQAAAPAAAHKKTSKRKYTVNESNVILRAVHKHVVGKTLPGKAECLRLLKSNKEFKGRTCKNLKDYVRNYKTAIERKMKTSSLALLRPFM